MERALQVENLCTEFRTECGTLKAVNGISFEVCEGETLGIVEKSGCGKSVTSQSILRPYDGKSFMRCTGDVRFHDKSLLTLSGK